MNSQTTITSKADAIAEIRRVIDLAITDCSKSLDSKGSAWLAIAGNLAEVKVSLYGVQVTVQANPVNQLESRTFRGAEVKQIAEYMGAQ